MEFINLFKNTNYIKLYALCMQWQNYLHNKEVEVLLLQELQELKELHNNKSKEEDNKNLRH